MKKTFYLFNPGYLERKDNTLKYTPFTINDDGGECLGTPRFLPVDLARLKHPAPCLISLAKTGFVLIFLTIMKTIPDLLCPANPFLVAK